MVKRILITGGCGFQGSNLSRRLLGRGYNVSILDTWSEISEKNIELFSLQKANIVWGSITDCNLVEKTVRDIDLVVHMAANIHVDDSINEPKKYYEVNVLGTNNILEYAKKNNISMIQISSCEVYGGQNSLLSENSPFKANSPYASSKAGADIMCYAYFKTYGMDITILRPTNVFGPGQRSGIRGAVIPIWINAALSGKEIKIYGDGNQSREFIYIDDLIDIYQIIVEKKLEKKNNFAGEIFNIGANQYITMKELSEVVSKVVSNCNIVHVESRLGEVRQFVLDSSKLIHCFDWKPKVSIEDGIRKYINWLQNV